MGKHYLNLIGSFSLMGVFWRETPQQQLLLQLVRPSSLAAT
jgi:hypothetical protein